ncbi:hypothetical protein EDC65_1480 [Stella humosa]|uniref:CopL family metal-binding regulatory protein n=1 Tax=Stella humosa TaxID=94 RepID=A0A3N1MEU0_9PROT|nr:hypothetical protein [Stella humosa]ROP99695.1 hypothetical protein EDC65_1480 [Stella humosa]BBK31079.1 hypothetical protein STHU_17130 [Stella humosa]
MRHLLLILFGWIALVATGTAAQAHGDHGGGHGVPAIERTADAAPGDAGDCPHAAGSESERPGQPTQSGHGCASSLGCCITAWPDTDLGRPSLPSRTDLGRPRSNERAGLTPFVDPRPPNRDRI